MTPEKLESWLKELEIEVIKVENTVIPMCFRVTTKKHGEGDAEVWNRLSRKEHFLKILGIRIERMTDFRDEKAETEVYMLLYTGVSDG